LGGGAIVKERFTPERHWRGTQARLILGGALILVVVGGGLIWLFYGRPAALVAVSCFLVVAAIGSLLWLVLRLLEMWVRGDEP
jgi:hypothetical protein